MGPGCAHRGGSTPKHVAVPPLYPITLYLGGLCHPIGTNRDPIWGPRCVLSPRHCGDSSAPSFWDVWMVLGRFALGAKHCPCIQTHPQHPMGCRGCSMGRRGRWVPVGSGHSQELGPIPDAGCAPWRASSLCGCQERSLPLPAPPACSCSTFSGGSAPQKSPIRAGAACKTPKQGTGGLVPCRQRSHQVPPLLRPLAVGCPKRIDFYFSLCKQRGRITRLLILTST